MKFEDLLWSMQRHTVTCLYISECALPSTIIHYKFISIPKNQHLRLATRLRKTAQRRKARCLPETFLSSSFYMLPSKSFHYGLERWVSNNLAVGNLLNHAVGGLDAHAVVLAGIDLCCGVSFL
jgi:hypothetical protein